MTKITKRVRIFAGPNGSGKSTIINYIRQIKIQDRPIDFGIYINADDIAQDLVLGTFRFSNYGLNGTKRNDFVAFALSSGLISTEYTEENLRSSFRLVDNNTIKLEIPSANERLAQIIAAFVRVKLMENGQKLSFETVFSHRSKIEFMRIARDNGYKVYLYFVSTETPTINVSRIKEVRVKDGGHDVPEEKIKSRYKRSMNNLYDAAQLAHQCYFFDNSTTHKTPKPFANFRVIADEKSWDEENFEAPEWFLKYYSAKVTSAVKK